MTQLKYNERSLETLLELHKAFTERLEVFIERHPEFNYNINLFIGEETHTIEVTVKEEQNAEGTTTTDSPSCN